MISASQNPNRLVYAIGDIHGHKDLLDDLLEQIREDAASHPAPGALKPVVIFLGGYIDRGPESVGVLRRVMGLCKGSETWAKFIGLTGNHEDLLLDTLAGDGNAAESWALSGGLALIDEVGITPSSGHSHSEITRQISEKIGEDVISWLKTLPALIRIPGYVFVHAGIDPSRSIENRDRETLIWTRSEKFLTRLDLPFRIVHGHTITPEPVIDGSRIGIDTGAHRNGRLTALKADLAGALSFLQALSPGLALEPVSGNYRP